MTTTTYQATYRIRAAANEIEARAQAIAIEQSVEMPLEAISTPDVLQSMVGRVVSIEHAGRDLFDVTIAFNAAVTGFEAGQLMNMLFGNSSIHDDVTLAAIGLPPELTSRFTGPRFGPDGLRARVGAGRRPLTCSALKPVGSSPAALATIARSLTLGGLDYIKDDHGLADQSFSPFKDRVAAISAAVREASEGTGKQTRYLPNISGNLDTLREQVRFARDHGLDTLLAAPMIIGLSAFQTIVRENADFAFIAHPALAGASRIAPATLYGRLFRMLGADGVIYPNAGGRFGYSRETCADIARTALSPWQGVGPCLPVPAGGMKFETLAENLAFYGPNVMVLIGGDLLAAREAMTARARAFQTAVESTGLPAQTAQAV